LVIVINDPSMYQAATMLGDSQSQSKHRRLLSKTVSGIMLQPSSIFRKPFLPCCCGWYGQLIRLGFVKKKHGADYVITTERLLGPLLNDVSPAEPARAVLQRVGGLLLAEWKRCVETSTGTRVQYVSSWEPVSRLRTPLNIS